MKQTELTHAQKATARRLNTVTRAALRSLISAERERLGGITDAPRLLEAAAAMFESSNVKTSTIFKMVQHTADAFRLSLEKDQRKKRRGRPPKDRWTAEQDEALLGYYDIGTQESAISDFNNDFKDAVFTMPVGSSSLAREFERVKTWKNFDRREKRIERFQRPVNEVIRQRLMRLIRQREDERIISSFDEEEEV